MRSWKDINKDSWSFIKNMAYGYGGGTGEYRASYAINMESGIFLNGRISADLKIAEWQSAGAGLVCRADELWTFLALYVAPGNEKESTVMRLAIFKQGIFLPIISSREKIYLSKDFNHFSLDFFSGQVRGEISTPENIYTLEYIVPHISFAGHVGLVKFYSATVTAKNIDISKIAGPNTRKGESKMKQYKYDVFISHSSKDRNIVDNIIQDLKSFGISYWVDHEQIRFGDYVTDKIESGLKESKSILVCVSSNLGQSNWCRAEYGPILNRELSQPIGKKVIPLRLDNCNDDEIPLLLYNIKRADYSNAQEYNDLLSFLKN